MKPLSLAFAALGFVVLAGCASQSESTIDDSPTSQTGNTPAQTTPSTVDSAETSSP
ncbi:hypothetical protein [Halotalea alkalilenta]|uniref:hypothetical protein n=1 Tax=Halotalea alkalilenta TaxID=376489 RepID=UPI0012DCEE61|nr:hypothetical protein [Halotalea alkalilenta]